jgi:CelD/BcsL family acetyltransferase involved in cellulose biosynthesis
MAPESELADGPGAVSAETRAAWDAMAVEQGRPCRLSAWQLAAAEHLGDGPLQIVLLRDGGRLVGVAPLLRNRWPGPLWIESVLQVGWNFGHGVAPLAAPGYEEPLARAIASRVPDLEPAVSMLTVAWDDLDSAWPERIAAAWEGRLRRRLEGSDVCPVVTMAESHDAWRAGKSRNFRETIKRKTKAIAKRGGTIRRADDPDRVGADVEGMFAVHRARFDALGKHSDLTDAHRDALVAAAPALLAGGHLRLWVVEHEGRVVAAQLHVRAGETMLFYNGGMDPDWTREAPGLVLLHEAVRDAHEIGARRFDLGPGAYDYKLRFADSEAAIGSHDLFVLDRRYPLVRARLARKHLTQAARRRAAALPDERREQLKRLLRRGRG